MPQSQGLRVSVFGGALVLISAALLLVLPDVAPAIGMMVGGLCVGAGFIWTLVGFYTGSE